MKARAKTKSKSKKDVDETKAEVKAMSNEYKLYANLFTNDLHNFMFPNALEYLENLL